MSGWDCALCGAHEDAGDGAEMAGPPVCWDCADARPAEAGLVAERWCLRVRTSADAVRLMRIDRALAYPDALRAYLLLASGEAAA